MIRQILINRSRILHRHPLSIIANFMIMRLITRISPRTLLGIVTSLAVIVSDLISNIGPLRTIRILLGIRQALNMEASIRVLRDILSGRANEVTVKEIVKILDPEWLKLVKKNITVIKLINVMIFITSTFLIIKPFFTIIIRTIFITFFAIFGIIYTPFLASYKFFRDIALFLLSLIPQSILNFFPNKIRMFYDKYNSSWFSWFPSIWRKDNKSKIDDIKQAAFGFGDSVFHEEKSWWDRYKYYIYGAISIISLFFILDLFKPDTPFISDITDFFRKSYNAVSSTIISAKSLVFYPANAIYEYFSSGESFFDKFKKWFNKNNNSENITVELNDNSKIAINKINEISDNLRKDIATHLSNNNTQAALDLNNKLNDYMEISNRIRDGRIKINSLSDLQFHFDNPPTIGEPSHINNSQSSENSQIDINDVRTNNPNNSIINNPTPININKIDLEEIERLSNTSQKAFSHPSTPIIENAVIPPAPPAPPAPMAPPAPSAPIQESKTNRDDLFKQIHEGKKLRKVNTSVITENKNLKTELNLEDKKLNKVPIEAINDKSQPNTSNAKTIIPDTRNEPLPGTPSNNPLLTGLSNKFDQIRTANSSPESDSGEWQPNIPESIIYYEKQIKNCVNKIPELLERITFLNASGEEEFDNKRFINKSDEIKYFNNAIESNKKSITNFQAKLDELQNMNNAKLDELQNMNNANIMAEDKNIKNKDKIHNIDDIPTSKKIEFVQERINSNELKKNSMLAEFRVLENLIKNSIDKNLDHTHNTLRLKNLEGRIYVLERFINNDKNYLNNLKGLNYKEDVENLYKNNWENNDDKHKFDASTNYPNSKDGVNPWNESSNIDTIQGLLPSDIKNPKQVITPGLSRKEYLKLELENKSKNITEKELENKSKNIKNITDFYSKNSLPLNATEQGITNILKPSSEIAEGSIKKLTEDGKIEHISVSSDTFMGQLLNRYAALYPQTTGNNLNNENFVNSLIKDIYWVVKTTHADLIVAGYDLWESKDALKIFLNDFIPIMIEPDDKNNKPVIAGYRERATGKVFSLGDLLQFIKPLLKERNPKNFLKEITDDMLDKYFKP